MLNNIINEIITDYPTEINKPFNNDNQFYLKIKNEFKPLFIEEITRILNENSINSDRYVKNILIGVGQWFNPCILEVYNKELNDKYEYGFSVSYFIDIKSKTVNVTINHSWYKFNTKIQKKFLDELVKTLVNNITDEEIPEGFERFDKNLNYTNSNSKMWKDISRVTILSKSYSFDDLQFNWESEFIELMKICDKLTPTYENLVKYNPKEYEKGLAGDFKEILDNYQSERRKPLKKNALAYKMDHQFKDDFHNLLKPLIKKEDFTAKISTGVGNWGKSTWADYYYNEAATSFQDGFYVFSSPDFEDNGWDFGLIFGRDKVDEETRLKCAKYLFKLARKEFPDLFEEDDLDYDQIYFNYLDYDDLTEGNIKNVFKELNEVYEFLIPYYLDFTKCKNQDKNQNMWMVRAGENSFLIEEFKKSNLVAIGWDIGDLSNKNPEEINVLINHKYSNGKKMQRAVYAAQIKKFVFDLKEGDYVLSQDKSTNTYLIGKITSDYYHESKILDTDSSGDSYHDLRDVKWLGEFSPADVSKDTKKTLEYPQTVFNIKDEAKKEILDITNIDEIEEVGGSMTSDDSRDNFYSYLRNRGYFFDKETVENYLLSLKVKPFVILTGNSGTGKTKLSQLFAEYLSDKANKEIVVSEEDQEYISIEVPIGQTVSKYLNEGKLFLDKRIMRRLLPIDKLEGNIEVEFDEHKSNERIYLLISGSCTNKSLESYFKSISKESSVTIKIKKEDVEKTFKQDKWLLNGNLNTNLTVGTNWLWNISKSDWHKILPVRTNTSWKVIINGKNAKADIKVYDLRLDALKSNNKELLDYFEKISSINPREKMDVTLDFNSFVSDYELSKEEEISEEEIIPEEPVETVKKAKGDRELYKIIPVGANWTENRHILGYQNLINNKYQSTPAFELIEEAAEDDEPYFLILDEMNLSHVERYFADFLSAIESEKSIPLYGKKEELKIPKNLFIVGTVNVDETTYMFSPKVLDRANTIEFDTCAPKKYLFEEFDDSNLEGNISYLENPLSDLNFDLRNIPMSELREEFKYVRVGFNKYFWPTLTEEINKFYNVLKGAGFDFGFRVIDEIVRFMYVAWKYEGEPTEFKNWQRYFDAQIKQKMLPKLHGSEKVLKKTLDDLINLCNKTIEVELETGEDDEDSIKTENKSYPVYIHSLVKLIEMKEVLKTQRYVSFIN